ncbi:MAG TPA: PD-(D/E)XK nuclease domain-containing protein, partial [Saprospiraceae bacterium]|nr:PD-(D/E)XK nuclease domain-containing protein [Saprospiraceae bacterium]
ITIIEEGVFCLEFKLDKTAQQAIDQIQHKGYLDAYRDKGKPCHMIGINFSSKDKRVEEVLWQGF